jgi:ribosomal protein S18 acetylase RimI-like enzyme
VIAIRRLDAGEARGARERLGLVLRDCVDGGASIGFMWPISGETAERWADGVATGVEQGNTVLFGGFSDGVLVGSVQLGLPGTENQRHRGDVRKLIVHRSGRRSGLAATLMQALEDEARARGLALLTLDTCAGSEAERLYVRLGWTRAGQIPDYAKWPDGRPCDTVLFWKRV